MPALVTTRSPVFKLEIKRCCSCCRFFWGRNSTKYMITKIKMNGTLNPNASAAIHNNCRGRCQRPVSLSGSKLLPLQICALDISCFVVRNELAAKLVKRAFVDLVLGLAHQIEIKMQIVQRDQAQPENLFGFNQMADITTTEFTATGAVATVFDRPLIPRKLRVFQIESAGRSKRGAIPR